MERTPVFQLTELDNQVSCEPHSFWHALTVYSLVGLAQKNVMRFTLKNCDSSFANALRRVMIAEIPTLAMHSCEIFVNTSPLFDDHISHRLGLLVLKSTAARFMNSYLDCSCEPEHGCPLCRVQFELDVTNTTDSTMLVTALDLKIVGPYADGVRWVLVPFFGLSLSH